MKQPNDAADGAGANEGEPQHGVAITSLRKRRLTGELYERDPKTEALLVELAALSRDALGVDRTTYAPAVHPKRVSGLLRARKPP